VLDHLENLGGKQLVVRKSAKHKYERLYVNTNVKGNGNIVKEKIKSKQRIGKAHNKDKCKENPKLSSKWKQTK
jgi:hypothetical protein